MRSALCVKKITKSEHTVDILSHFVEIVHSIFHFSKQKIYQVLISHPCYFCEVPSPTGSCAPAHCANSAARPITIFKSE